MRTITDAMILAAGMGNRMQPLTRTMPKPLITVLGCSLLDRALDVVARANITSAVVNVHYLAEQVVAHCASRKGLPNVSISNERAQLLETGGGLKHALPLLHGDAFAVMNADNVWPEAPVLETLTVAWQPDIMDALLLLVPTQTAVGYDGAGDFSLTPAMQPVRRGDAPSAPYVFTGAQILKRITLDNTPAGPFSLNLVYDRALTAGRLYAVVHTHGWYHVGTPEGVRLAEAALKHNGD